MDTVKKLAMGAMVAWGDVRIGVMSAQDDPGQEKARLRLMSPQGSVTVEVPVGESRTVDGVGTVLLHSVDLHHHRGDGPAPTGRGSVDVSFEPVPTGDDR